MGLRGWGALAGLACLLGGASAESWEEYALAQQALKGVVDIGMRQFNEWVQDGNRQSKIILVMTVPEDEYYRCPDCKTMNPAIEKISYNYNKHYRANHTGEQAVHFVRMWFTHSNRKAWEHMRGERIPLLVAFPKGKKMIKFETDPGRDADNKKLEELLSPAAVARKKNQDKNQGKSGGRKSKSVDKWHRRAAQREKRYNSLAIGSLPIPDTGAHTDENYIRFVRRNGKIPEIQIVEEPPKYLKMDKVFLMIVLFGLLVAVAYTRLAYFPDGNPNLDARLEQMWLRGMTTATGLRPPSMRPATSIFPQMPWFVISVLAMNMFLFLAGGFYFNHLNPSEWSGKKQDGSPEYVMTYGRGQYGVEPYFVAGIGMLFTVCFLGLLLVPRVQNSQQYFFYFPIAFCAFYIALAATWTMFLKKNAHFMGGTPHRGWIDRLTAPVALAMNL